MVEGPGAAGGDHWSDYFNNKPGGYEPGGEFEGDRVPGPGYKRGRGKKSEGRPSVTTDPKFAKKKKRSRSQYSEDGTWIGRGKPPGFKLTTEHKRKRRSRSREERYGSGPFGDYFSNKPGGYEPGGEFEGDRVPGPGYKPEKKQKEEAEKPEPKPKMIAPCEEGMPCSKKEEPKAEKKEEPKEKKEPKERKEKKEKNEESSGLFGDYFSNKPGGYEPGGEFEGEKVPVAAPLDEEKADEDEDEDEDDDEDE